MPLTEARLLRVNEVRAMPRAGVAEPACLAETKLRLEALGRVVVGTISMMTVMMVMVMVMMVVMCMRF